MSIATAEKINNTNEYTEKSAFDALYQDVLSLNQKMDKIKQNNVEVLDQEL